MKGEIKLAVGDKLVNTDHARAMYQNLDGKIGDLKSDVDIFNNTNQTSVAWVRGSLKADTGAESTQLLARRCRTGAIMLDNQIVTTDKQSQFIVYLYNGGTSSSNYLGKSDWINSCDVKAFALSSQATEGADRFRLMGAMADNTTNIGDGSSDDVSDCAKHIFILDSVNDKLSAFSLSLGANNFTWQIRKGINGNTGNYSGNENFASTEDIPVRHGQKITNLTGDIGASGYDTVMHIAQYNDSGFITNGRVVVSANETYTIPSGVTKIRIMYGYGNSDSSLRAAMTWELLKQYFKVQMQTDIAQYDTVNVEQKPILVTFGASTTAGAVHHQTNPKITYTSNAWPDYLGKVLGMDVYNLGVGDTGFMKRGYRDADTEHYGDPEYYPNICDSILQNDEILSKASMIAIMFGYGNDYNCGPVGTNARFPVGSYDDYYDYYTAKTAQSGETGYIENFSNVNGMKEMIDDGATLMGCLNWCIKYLNEQYPYAQLVIIFGSPSANGPTDSPANEHPGRKIAVDENNPHKIVFSPDPYYTAAQSSSSSKEKGVYEIHTQIEQLKEKMNISIVDLFYGGNAFSYWSTMATEPGDGNTDYALFSTTGTAQAPTWNSHPNDIGYMQFGRYLAGRITGLFDR